MKIALCSVVMLLMAGPAAAQSPFVQFLDGNSLKQMCESEGNGGAICNGYLVGIADSTSLEILKKGTRPFVCIPSITKVEQLYDTVMNYMKLHPAERSMPAAAVVFNAYRSEFPCNKR